MKPHFPVLLVLLIQIICLVKTKKCPNGDNIYEWGISADGKKVAVSEHNKYRRAIMDGKVPGQPKGKNILTMTYDDELGKKGQLVSKTCKMQHVIASDNRWRHVGQNLFISWNSVKSCDQNWAEAIRYWYTEYKLYKYPNRPSAATGHYTQLVWHDSSKIGCDFICFYDSTKPQYPYARLYTCNYGPGGNIIGLAPYALA
ncbi:CRISP/Allergen/PR-1-like [Atheta coriaria]|uniref:CRISP/Allergen/PR-1-like n=1 Tax=Dalotia coriaria TaxID=877792 RepID=UPI0031F450F5